MPPWPFELFRRDPSTSMLSTTAARRSPFQEESLPGRVSSRRSLFQEEKTKGPRTHVVQQGTLGKTRKQKGLALTSYMTTPDDSDMRQKALVTKAVYLLFIGINCEEIGAQDEGSSRPDDGEISTSLGAYPAGGGGGLRTTACRRRPRWHSLGQQWSAALRL